MKIKICGITNLQDAHYVLSLGADAIGFVFYPESKRYIKPEDAAEIIYTLPAFTLKVGVFVNAKVDKVNRVATQSGINIVQLHGEEPPDYVNDIAYPVIKTFRINDAFDFNILDNYSKCSFLLDTFDTSDYGGTGKTFNWNVIPDVLIKKIILAGGISEHNIEYILLFYRYL